MSVVAAHTPLPPRQRLRLVLEDLTHAEVEFKDGAGAAPRSTNCVALYVNDKLATSALLVADLECAARLGGAHAELTRREVNDAIVGRHLQGQMLENVREVWQSLAGVFNRPGGQQTRFYEMYAGEDVPTDIAGITASARDRMDLEVMVSGYGRGSLSVFVR